MQTEERVRRLAERYPRLPVDCGNEERPGVVDDSEWGDYSEHHTSPDQLRIESYLIGQPLRNARVLHVGVGNSNFARRFHGSVGSILGTTVVEAERRKALKLGLPRYRCILHNKYLGADERIGRGYDYVIENSPTTYACCLTHFAKMMEFYGEVLGREGQLVTDLRGLAHLIDLRPELADFSFGFEDLAWVAPVFGLTAYRVDESVFVLARRNPPAGSLIHRSRFYARRLRDKISGA